MNAKKSMVAVIMIITAASATLYTRNASSPEAKRDRLTRDFTAIMPEKYDAGQRNEVSELLERFNNFYDERRVSKKDFGYVADKLRRFVGAGAISTDSLTYFMAEVGHLTFKSDPSMNMGEGYIDHPTLNPESAIFVSVLDTARYRRLGIPLPSERDSAWTPPDSLVRNHPELFRR